MRTIVLICLAAILFILVPRAARTGAAFPAPIIVPEGGSVTIPAPAVVRADTSAPDVAQAVPGSDEVTVRGIKPGAAVLMLLSPGSLEARPIQIVPAGTGGGRFDVPTTLRRRVPCTESSYHLSERLLCSRS